MVLIGAYMRIFQEERLRTRIKLATDTIHEDLNQWSLVTTLMAGTATQATYAQFLTTTAKYRLACEEAIEPFAKEFNSVLQVSRYFTGSLLLADLEEMNKPIGGSLIQADQTSFDFNNKYQALGGLYVLAGSSNGNRMIMKSVFGNSPDRSWPRRYLSNSTEPSAWRQFCDALEKIATDQPHADDVVFGAKHTFEQVAKTVL